MNKNQDKSSASEAKGKGKVKEGANKATRDTKAEKHGGKAGPVKKDGNSDAKKATKSTGKETK